MQIDFNLFGMGHLRMEDVYFRHPIPEAQAAKRRGWREAESLVCHEIGPSGE